MNIENCQRLITTCYADAVRSSRFRGGRQQDSHELLRHLMDGVKEEHKELKRIQVCMYSLAYREILVVHVACYVIFAASSL